MKWIKHELVPFQSSLEAAVGEQTTRDGQCRTIERSRKKRGTGRDIGEIRIGRQSGRVSARRSGRVDYERQDRRCVSRKVVPKAGSIRSFVTRGGYSGRHLEN